MAAGRVGLHNADGGIGHECAKRPLRVVQLLAQTPVHDREPAAGSQTEDHKPSQNIRHKTFAPAHHLLTRRPRLLLLD